MGACIQKSAFNGGSKKQYFLSDMEMVDFAIGKPAVDQRIRKFLLLTHKYQQGKIGKDEMMRRARRHYDLIQMGELNGCQPSIVLKRKSPLQEDSDDESEGFEGLVNTEFFSNVNVQLTKINFFGAEPYSLQKSQITISESEYEKLLETIQKYLSKKGKVYETVEIDADIWSDNDLQDDQEQEEEIVPLAPVKRRKGRKGAAAGKGCKRAKGKGGKRGSDNDEEDEEEEGKAVGKYKPFGGRGGAGAGGSSKLVI